MQKITILAGAFALLTGAASLAAQEADTTAPAAEVADETAPAEVADETAPAEVADETAPAEEAQPAHDWEFALSATDKAPGAVATVKVVDAEEGSDFVLVANGLPVVDSLDDGDQDVNAYTVWVVADKDKVGDSELAGVLTLSPEGTGQLEGKTSLETFGIIVTATPDGAPEKIGGVPVLTGIPVVADEPVEEAVEEAVDEAADAVEVAAEETVEAADEVADEAADVADEAAEVTEEVVDETEPDATP